VPRVLFALSRHGSYEQPESVPSAHLPYGLTPEGKQQVNGLIEEVLGFCRQEDCVLDAVIATSPLLRAWQTASIAARKISRDVGFEVRVVEDHALTERCLGSLANLTTDQIVRVVSSDPRFKAPPSDWKTNANYRLPMPGAESLRSAGERVANCLTQAASRLAQESKRDCLRLVIGHGGSICHAAVTLELLHADRVTALSMHHCRPVFWEWTSSGSFRHVAGEWKIRPQGGAHD